MMDMDKCYFVTVKEHLEFANAATTSTYVFEPHNKIGTCKAPFTLDKYPSKLPGKFNF